MKVSDLLFENSDSSAKEKREKRERDILRKDYATWKRLVNIPTKILRASLPTGRGLKTGLSEKDKKQAKNFRIANNTARAILRLRQTPLSQWKTADVNWMYRQLKYIQTFRSKDMPLKRDGKPTDTLKNLWAWGHIPRGIKPKDPS